MAKQRGLAQIFNLNYFSSDLILKNLPFVLFLGFLGLVYIANAHYAERNVRQIQLLQKEVKELRWYYMSLESEIMFNSKRSEMIEKVKPVGLRPLSSKPKKIVVSE
ncbi:MAG: hypothetical protein IPJ74_19570 [Saprospiraceae bacterium]|nr:hypothetical protein [Saprospiraceae bacterium]